MQRRGEGIYSDVRKVAEVLDDADGLTFWGLRGTQESPRSTMQLAGCNQLTTFVNRCGDTSRMTQTGNVGETIEHLRNTRLIAVQVLDTEITSG